MEAPCPMPHAKKLISILFRLLILILVMFKCFSTLFDIFLKSPAIKYLYSQKRKSNIMSSFQIGRYFEDFTPGEIIEHSTSKTIFESDNNLFSLLTMNHHPVHTNIDYAAKQQHGQILVVGSLVFSLAVGMTVPDISGKAIANLMYENIDHVAPVFVNDTIYVKTTVLECKESKTKPDRGIVYVESVAHNQRNETVLKFRRKVLIKKRGY
jgi:acyl dehydratase